MEYPSTALLIEHIFNRTYFDDLGKMMPKETKVKVMKAKIQDRTFLERAYLPEIAKGLRITATHFWQNLSVHIRRLFGIRTKEKGSATYQYPEERRPLSPRLRSLHRLTKREDGTPRCVACMMCETICPAKCIYIIGVDHPDPNIEKKPAKFDIDIGVCVFCGLCVEACPEDAIRMDTGILEISSYTREGMIYNMKDLLR
jgi:NADH-quinone oxidoreductase subunit I